MSSLSMTHMGDHREVEKVACHSCSTAGTFCPTQFSRQEGHIPHSGGQLSELHLGGLFSGDWVMWVTAGLYTTRV